MSDRPLPPRGFLVVVATVALSLAAAGVPSALYSTYRHDYGFSALTQSALFATYAVALFPALLVGGRLLERRSGASVLTAGVTLVMLADLLFAHDAALGELFVARAVQGVGIGLINAAAGVLALTTRPDGDPKRAALGTALATALGLGVGALGAGIWLDVGPEPTLWPYVAHGLLALCLVAVLRPLVRPVAPTRSDDAGPAEQASRATPRGRLTLTCAAVLLAWGYGGMLLAVLPDLAAQGHTTNGLLGPLLLAMMFISVAVSEWLTSRHLLPARGLLVGVTTLGVGGTALVLAASVGGTALLAGAGILLGIGLGSTFVSGIALANGLISADRRHVLLPVFYSCVFAGNAIPALVAGYLAGHLSLAASVMVISAAMAAACLVLSLLCARSARRSA